MTKAQISLKKYFQHQAGKWGLIGLLVTLGFGIPFVISEIKSASETRLIFAAKNLSDAYRDDILDRNFRSVEDHIAASLSLKDGEGAVIIDPNLKPAYDSPRAASYPCSFVEKVCWSKSFNKITYLQPVYFDPISREGLKAYLQLTISPILDWLFVMKFSAFLLLGFIVQTFGMLSALSHCAKMVKSSLSRWTERLCTPTNKDQLQAEAPFVEMVPTQTAIDNLPAELARLENRIEQDSKFRAQLSIVRQVGHDIGTPVSQLGRYWEMLADELKTKGIKPGEDSAGINRALDRIRDLILSLESFNHDFKNFTFIQDGTELSEEVKNILKDLELALEFRERKIKMQGNIEVISGRFFIPKTDLYRIIENLVRNSVEALPPSKNLRKNTISVTLTNGDLGAILRIEDNGIGIPRELQNQIFNPDVTTKLSRGTGLGLAFVKDKCSQLEAELKFESNENGTVFIIEFKRSQILKVGNYGEVSNLSC